MGGMSKQYAAYFVGWLRARTSRRAQWLKVSVSADEAMARHALWQYIYETGIKLRQISAVVLPAGQHPMRRATADP